jgi:hypothetical protein
LERRRCFSFAQVLAVMIDSLLWDGVGPANSLRLQEHLHARARAAEAVLRALGVEKRGPQLFLPRLDRVSGGPLQGNQARNCVNWPYLFRELCADPLEVGQLTKA